jgi:hypothetical protein
MASKFLTAASAAALLGSLLVPRAVFAATNEELVKRLANKDTAKAALEALVAQKEAALPTLIGEALEGHDLASRGWAIVGISRIGGKDADTALRTLHNDEKQPVLPRTWAAAGRIEMAKSFETLIDLAPLAQRFPAVRRPLTMRLTAMASSSSGVSADKLIAATINDYNMQQALIEPILALGSDRLLDAMVHSKDQNVRMQAAAYVATLAQRQGKAGNEIVGTAVAKTYAFKVGATDVPWAGGPLYVPNIGWQKDYGTKLVSGLMSWLIWADRNHKDAEKQQIINNLNSYSLAEVVGYQMNWNEPTPEGWIKTWGAVVGKAGIEKLLAEQGLKDDSRYDKAMMMLK